MRILVSNAATTRKITMLIGVCLFCLLSVLTLAGCGMSAHSLTGEYSAKQGGQSVFKIFNEGGRFLVAVPDHTGWSSPTELVPMEKADIDQVFRPTQKDYDAHIAEQVVGLKAKDHGTAFMILGLPKGSKLCGKTFTTGYFVSFVLLLNGDVYKL